MKEANLISILSAFKKLDSDLFKLYLKYHSIYIREGELNDLEVLVTCLKPLTKKINIFDKYFIGYKIPQISKEFDLLRIDDESVVNIELKRRCVPEKVKKQLLRNKYYLSFLKREIHLFTFVAEENKLYSIDDDKNLIELNIKQLLAKLASQDVKKNREIDSYFNPSNYLVSPFNSTIEFIKEKYFLTDHQEKIRKLVFDQFDILNYSIISIKGKAGTGKTLLTYDIAKEVYRDKDVLIIHCGYLNNGHMILRDDYGWHIIPAKELFRQDLSQFF